MKALLFAILGLGLAAPALAQRPTTTFSTMGLYQWYTVDGITLSEASFPMALSVPLTRRVRATLATTPASATGDGVTTLGGFTDVQASLSYGIEIGLARLTASVRGNLPSGKSDLSADEFTTAWYLSQTFYEFRVPGFGQGFNFGPGLTGAFPLSDNFVLGAGISYQVRGAYSPLATGLGEYDPGDELFVVGGVDYRLDPATSIALDLTYTRFGADALGDGRTFEAGSKLTGAVQLRRLFGFHELRVAARIRNRNSGTLALDGLLQQELQTVPQRADVRTAFRYRVDADLAVEFSLHGRFYGSTESFDAQQVVDVGIAPSIRAFDHVVVHSLFRYTAGTFSGLEGGLGFTVEV